VRLEGVGGCERGFGGCERARQRAEQQKPSTPARRRTCPIVIISAPLAGGASASPSGCTARAPV